MIFGARIALRRTRPPTGLFAAILLLAQLSQKQPILDATASFSTEWISDVLLIDDHNGDYSQDIWIVCVAVAFTNHIGGPKFELWW